MYWANHQIIFLEPIQNNIPNPYLNIIADAYHLCKMSYVCWVVSMSQPVCNESIIDFVFKTCPFLVETFIICGQVLDQIKRWVNPSNRINYTLIVLIILAVHASVSLWSHRHVKSLIHPYFIQVLLIDVVKCTSL